MEVQDGRHRRKEDLRDDVGRLPLHPHLEGAQGVRDIWRDLGLSTPSLAHYHVNKLLDLKLIETTREGKYMANEGEKVEALRSFLRLRGRLVPRLVVYGALLSGILISYLLLWPFRWDFRDLVTLTVCVFGTIVFFFEAYRQYCGLTVFK